MTELPECMHLSFTTEYIEGLPAPSTYYTLSNAVGTISVRVQRSGLADVVDDLRCMCVWLKDNEEELG
jgi:hypothetical protein